MIFQRHMSGLSWKFPICYDKNKKFNIKNFWILDTTLILFMVPDPPKQEFIYSLLLVSL